MSLYDSVIDLRKKETFQDKTIKNFLDNAKDLNVNCNRSLAYYIIEQCKDFYFSSYKKFEKDNDPKYESTREIREKNELRELEKISAFLFPYGLKVCFYGIYPSFVKEKGENCFFNFSELEN